MSAPAPWTSPPMSFTITVAPRLAIEFKTQSNNAFKIQIRSDPGYEVIIGFLPSSRAYSRPRPFPAPVTKATLPSKPFLVISN